MFDLFSGFTLLTIHPDTIPLTAFSTPNGLYEWLRMPQGAAGSPTWLVSVMHLVTDGLGNIRMYLDNAMGSDASPMAHVATLATGFARLRLHNLKLSPKKSRIDAARVDCCGKRHLSRRCTSQRRQSCRTSSNAHVTRHQTTIQLTGRPQLLAEVFTQHGQTRALKHTSLLNKGAMFDFTPPMEAAVCALLAELAAPSTLVFPDWDGVIDRSRPFRLHRDASTDGLGGTLEQEQLDGSIRPIVYISRTTFSNERYWTPMELEAACIVWSIRRLRRYLSSVFSNKSAK